MKQHSKTRGSKHSATASSLHASPVQESFVAQSPFPYPWIAFSVLVSLILGFGILCCFRTKKSEQENVLQHNLSATAVVETSYGFRGREQSPVRSREERAGSDAIGGLEISNSTLVHRARIVVLPPVIVSPYSEEAARRFSSSDEAETDHRSKLGSRQRTIFYNRAGWHGREGSCSTLSHEESDLSSSGESDSASETSEESMVGDQNEKHHDDKNSPQDHEHKAQAHYSSLIAALPQHIQPGSAMSQADFSTATPRRGPPRAGRRAPTRFENTDYSKW